MVKNLNASCIALLSEAGIPVRVIQGPDGEYWQVSRHISFIESGWQIRFKRKKDSFSKSFSASVHGGYEESLIAAVEHLVEAQAARPRTEEIVHKRPASLVIIWKKSGKNKPTCKPCYSLAVRTDYLNTTKPPVQNRHHTEYLGTKDKITQSAIDTAVLNCCAVWHWAQAMKSAYGRDQLLDMPQPTPEECREYLPPNFVPPVHTMAEVMKKYDRTVGYHNINSLFAKR